MKASAGTAQRALFDEIELPPAERCESKIAERRRKARLAYEKTSEAWKDATYKFAVDDWLLRHETFVFEELTHDYNAIADKGTLPATVNGKAFAGLQARLVREGKISKIEGEMRSRSNAQQGLVYRSNLYTQ